MQHAERCYAPHTERAYAQRFGRWCRWAVDHGKRALPADGGAVLEYVRELVGENRSRSLIEQTLRAIAVMHARAGHAAPDVRPELITLLRRAYRPERRDDARTRTLIVRLTVAELERLQRDATAARCSARRLARERVVGAD